MSISGVPRSISTTPGCSTAPEIVTRDVPGSSTSPWARNASGPVRAIIATCASVSALWTRAPRRPMRRAVPLSGRKDGRDWPDSTQRTSADSSPAMKRSGGRTMTSGTGAQPAATRSARARATAAATWWRPSGTQTRHASRAAGGGQELRAVEHEVRRTDEEELVLVAGRLPLHGVDHDGAAAARGVRDGELDGGREPGPAAAGQAGGLERRDEGLAPAPGAGRRAAGRGPARRRDRPGRSDGRAAGSGRWWAGPRSR